MPKIKKACIATGLLSGKRDSNSRPRPWQGRALPTELFSQYFGLNILFSAFENSVANIELFFLSPKRDKNLIRFLQNLFFDLAKVGVAGSLAT